MVIFAVSLAISCIIITLFLLNSQYRSRKALLWDAFKFLTSGECFHRQVNGTDTWYFRWSR